LLSDNWEVRRAQEREKEKKEEVVPKAQSGSYGNPENR
jgi:hypothetical protein